jgi:multidrug transporter EmrE-like cation transporter
MGLFFAYIGYLLIEGKKVNKWIGISLVVIGILALLYHSHLLYVKNK